MLKRLLLIVLFFGVIGVVVIVSPVSAQAPSYIPPAGYLPLIGDRIYAKYHPEVYQQCADNLTSYLEAKYGQSDGIIVAQTCSYQAANEMDDRLSRVLDAFQSRDPMLFGQVMTAYELAMAPRVPR